MSCRRILISAAFVAALHAGIANAAAIDVSYTSSCDYCAAVSGSSALTLSEFTELGTLTPYSAGTLDFSLTGAAFGSTDLGGGNLYIPRQDPRSTTPFFVATYSTGGVGYAVGDGIPPPRTGPTAPGGTPPTNPGLSVSGIILNDPFGQILELTYTNDTGQTANFEEIVEYPSGSPSGSNTVQTAAPLSSSVRACSASSTVVLPVLTTCFGPRTA